MGPDPQHCFDCDRGLDGPPAHETRRFRRCPSCQADLDTHIAALGDLETVPPPQFRGVIALGASLPDWPTDITLLAITVWDRFSELNIVDVPGPNPPRAHPRAMSDSLGGQPPHKWTITTDADTAHHGGPASGGTPGTDRLLAWRSTIAPTLPDHAWRLDVHAQAPGATSRTTIDLTPGPLTRQRAAIDQPHTPTDADPDCPSCGPPRQPTPAADPAPSSGPDLDWAMPMPPEPSPSSCGTPDPRPLCSRCRTSRHEALAAKIPTNSQPDRVIALGAELGHVFGAQLAIPALTTWPTWFDLTIVGHHSGDWADALGATKRAGRWSAHDDQGNHYIGASTGGGSGLGLAHTDLSFIPTLAPDATTLTVAFPSSLDGQVLHATIDLQPPTASNDL